VFRLRYPGLIANHGGTVCNKTIAFIIDHVSFVKAENDYRFVYFENISFKCRIFDI
jgi:hypothetical protein